MATSTGHPKEEEREGVTYTPLRTTVLSQTHTELSPNRAVEWLSVSMVWA